jgi:hypothetical protein
MVIGSSERQVFFSILLSSGLLIVIHVSIGELHIMPTIFEASMIVAYVYYCTKSAMFPVFGCVSASIFSYPGLSGGIIPCVIYSFIALLNDSQFTSNLKA